GLELLLRARDQLADIGQNDGRYFLLDELVNGVGDVAFVRRDDVGIGRERALDIIERREQRLRGLARLARDDADSVPLRAGIEKMDRAGRSLAGDLDAGNLVADLERQV